LEHEETTGPVSSGLNRDTVEAVAKRLREVRRRCSEDASAGGGNDAALEVLDAVLKDLDGAMSSEAGVMTAADVDLGLATVEEMFRDQGSHGIVLVISSIRSSLALPGSNDGDDEEPPPPVRFQPSATSASRRRRPRPEPPRQEVRETRGKGRSGLVIIAVFVIGVAATVGWLRFGSTELEPQAPAATDPMVGDRQLVSSMPALAPPPVVPRSSGAEEDFDSYEEDMASFTFEINLAEEAVAEGRLNEALRHFAAAAAIDREQPRVVVMGKYLIASMLREGDLAHAAGDADRTVRKIRSAFDLERGLGLDGGPEGNDHPGELIDDIDLETRDDLDRGVGHPVRLILKSGDVVYGRAAGREDDHLVFNVYAGTRGGGNELSTRMLTSTIRQLRIYRRPPA